MISAETLGQMPLGLFPKRLLVVGGGLVEIIVASLVGAWLYKADCRRRKFRACPA
jgi:hypothetical protein